MHRPQNNLHVQKNKEQALDDDEQTLEIFGEKKKKNLISVQNAIVVVDHLRIEQQRRFKCMNIFEHKAEAGNDFLHQMFFSHSLK